MRIEEDIKLDYSDVLFRPKRSTLHSRKEVELRRTYKFKHSNNEWSGIPIMAANMDGVGELEVGKSLAKFELMTCLTKQHDVKKIKQFNYSNYSYSCYLRFEVKDKPGVLSQITKQLAKYKISIARLIQNPDHKRKTASIIIITHKVKELYSSKCIKSFKSNKNVLKSPILIRLF